MYYSVIDEINSRRVEEINVSGAINVKLIIKFVFSTTSHCIQFDSFLVFFLAFNVIRTQIPLIQLNIIDYIYIVIVEINNFYRKNSCSVSERISSLLSYLIDFLSKTRNGAKSPNERQLINNLIEFPNFNKSDNQFNI